MDYTKHIIPPTSTPGTQRARTDQVQNQAGGFVFALDSWKQLDRFLILGAEGNTYYASERKQVTDNVRALDTCLAADGLRTVRRIVEISEDGRAPKNDPAVFALAYASKRATDPVVRQAANKAMPSVCRTGTHLFQFVDTVNKLGGWGRGSRRAVADWYLQKEPEQLALQLVKYQQRDGWSHRDCLRLAHPHAVTKVTQQLLAYATGKLGADAPAPMPIIEGVRHVQAATSAGAVAALIAEYNLPREVVPTQWLNDVNVWSALLERMPLTALIRNLGKMSAVGLLQPLSAAAKKVVAKLTNAEALAKARVHPIAVLSALRVYQQGRGERGSNTWTPVQTVVDALNDAFYAAFGHVQPSGKNFLLGVDCSGSMTMGAVAGIPGLTPNIAAAAFAMQIARVERDSHIMGFSNKLIDLKVTAKDSLADAMRKTQLASFGATDCALPMVTAQQNRWDVDAFVVITDNETYAGRTQPFQALKEYRRSLNKPHAVSAVVGMTATGFTIADPTDPGMLDCVGFDVAAPQLISDFAAGKV